MPSCDVTCKINTKSVAINVSHEFNLSNFGSFASEEYGFKDAEHYLIRLLHWKFKCLIFVKLLIFIIIIIVFVVTVLLLLLFLKTYVVEDCLDENILKVFI